jgi:ABC-2 type transport system permease protein
MNAITATSTTSTTVTSSAPTIRVAASHPTRTARHDLAAVPAAIGSEWIKLRSLRSTPAVLAATVALGLGMSWVLATVVKTDPYDHEPFTISQTFVVSTVLTTVLAALAGTLSFTSEVQHGTLATTVAGQPARGVLVVAKAAVAAVLGLVLGAAGMAAGYVGAVLGGLEAGDTSGVPATIGWALLITALAPVFGLGVGIVLRHSALSVSVLLVWAFVLENLIRGFASPSIARFLPFSAVNGLLGTRSAGDTDATVAAALSRPQDAVLFGGYVVVALAVGSVLLARRDVD